MRSTTLVGWAALSLIGASPMLATSPATALARPITCHGATATIVGTSGDDTLIGTPGRDVIVGRAGDDRIRGLGGDDVLCGNVGADIIQGGPGDDRLYGGIGVGEGYEEDAGDRVWAGDLLEGGPGADHLDVGHEENPYVSPTQDVYETLSFARSGHGVHVDLAKGTARGQGHDTVAETVVEQRLQVIGTRQDDTVRAGSNRLYFWGGSGDDKAIGGQGSDALYPGSEATYLAFRGLPGKIGVGGHDTASGRAGDDQIETGEGGGRDTLRGGQGADRIGYDGPAAIHLDAGAGDDEVDVRLTDRHGSFVSMGPAGDAADLLYLRPAKAQKIDWDMTTGGFLVDGEDRDIQVTASPHTWLYGHMVEWTVSGTDLAEELLVTNVSGLTTFYGRGGDDLFRGGKYDDVFDGGDGDDTYVSDQGGTNTCVLVENDPSDACST